MANMCYDCAKSITVSTRLIISKINSKLLQLPSKTSKFEQILKRHCVAFVRANFIRHSENSEIQRTDSGSRLFVYLCLLEVRFEKLSAVLFRNRFILLQINHSNRWIVQYLNKHQRVNNRFLWLWGWIYYKLHTFRAHFMSTSDCSWLCGKKVKKS